MYNNVYQLKAVLRVITCLIHSHGLVADLSANRVLHYARDKLGDVLLVLTGVLLC